MWVDEIRSWFGTAAFVEAAANEQRAVALAALAGTAERIVTAAREVERRQRALGWTLADAQESVIADLKAGRFH